MGKTLRFKDVVMSDSFGVSSLYSFSRRTRELLLWSYYGNPPIFRNGIISLLLALLRAVQHAYRNNWAVVVVITYLRMMMMMRRVFPFFFFKCIKFYTKPAPIFGREEPSSGWDHHLLKDPTFSNFPQFLTYDLNHNIQIEYSKS